MSDEDKKMEFPAISKNELQVFDLDRGLKVNEAICQLHRKAEDILRMMTASGAWYKPVNMDDPVAKTQTFQRLKDISEALDELAELTKPTVQSRF